MDVNLDSLIAGNPASPDSGIFGVSVPASKAFLSIIPICWDATASYGLGTDRGPSAILRASHQLDLEDLDFDKPYLQGILLLNPDIEIGILNQLTRKDATMVREDPAGDVDDLRAQIDANGEMINQKVYDTARSLLGKDRFCAVLGGDHSSPFGLIKALSEKYDHFGILHIDAHFDLRQAYEGFQWSHASIMGNCLRELAQIEKIVHVGIRDFSHEEKTLQQSLGKRSDVFYSSDLFSRRARGISFQSIVAEIICALPPLVYISFDIDGLDPSLCPSTGTPVPGGLQFEEAMFLIVELAKSGKKIIGFDLCEVAESPGGNEWDANVGARVLYKLCGALIRSQSGS